mgnify:CR=1 FL=1
MNPKENGSTDRFSFSQRRTETGWEAVVAGSLSVLVLLMVGACDGYKTIPPETAQAVVHGHVTTASGEAVDDASILPRAHFVSCDSSGASQGVAYSRDDGTYEQHVVGLTDAEVACVTITVDTPPIEDDQDEADTTVTTDLRLRYEPPYDSVRVDIALKPARKQ